MYEVIVSSEVRTKNCQDFCSHYTRAEILAIFCLYFGKNDDFINSFWQQLTFIPTKDFGILSFKMVQFFFVTHKWDSKLCFLRMYVVHLRMYICFHAKKASWKLCLAADPAAIVRPVTFCKALNVKPKLYIPRRIILLSLVYWTKNFPL